MNFRPRSHGPDRRDRSLKLAIEQVLVRAAVAGAVGAAEGPVAVGDLKLPDVKPDTERAMGRAQPFDAEGLFRATVLLLVAWVVALVVLVEAVVAVLNLVVVGFEAVLDSVAEDDDAVVTSTDLSTYSSGRGRGRLPSRETATVIVVYPSLRCLHRSCPTRQR